MPITKTLFNSFHKQNTTTYAHNKKLKIVVQLQYHEKQQEQ